MDSSDVCRALNISKRALQSYRVRGIIPSSMLGGKVYFREADIAEWLQKGKPVRMATGESIDKLGYK
jgi:DNA-binding transcriptional MerR regulator